MATRVAGVQPASVSRDLAPSIHRLQWRRLPVHLVVLGVTAIWLIPLLGLLVSSFRPAPAVLSTGWCHSFALPGDYTIENYRKVLDCDGLLLSFFNSVYRMSIL